MYLREYARHNVSIGDGDGDGDIVIGNSISISIIIVFCRSAGTANLPWPSSRQPLQGMIQCRGQAANNVGLDCGSISLEAKHFNGQSEYNMHSLFGHMEAIATSRALAETRNARPVVITRSTVRTM